MRTPRTLVGVPLLLAALSACSSGGPTVTAQASPVAPPSATLAVPATAPPDTSSPAPTGAGPSATAAPAAAGCARRGSGVPAGAAHRTIPDVDGDGRPDTLWVTGGSGRTVGITTASGATLSAAIQSASPIAAQVLAARPRPDGPVDVLVDLGRETDVLTLSGCTLVPAVDARGQAYVFDMEELRGHGTGVGCVGPGGRRGLTGLDAHTTDGRTYQVTRTLVLQSGRVLRNGASDVLPAVRGKDDALLASAQTVTCGDLTLARDGLGEPRA